MASWKEVTNSDILYYEVRKDQHPGAETQSLLARTNNLSTVLPLTDRAGTLYLYARSAGGKYSTPAALEYNKPAPPKPEPPELSSRLGGFGILAGAIPTGCNGMNIYIDAAPGGPSMLHVANNAHSYTCGSGIYDVQVAYTDLFGEGEKSGEARVQVEMLIDESMLKKGIISLAACDKFIQASLVKAEEAIPRLKNLDEEISQVQQTAQAITQTVQGHGDAISQVQQTAQGLDAKIQNAESNLSTLISQNADSISTIVSNFKTEAGLKKYSAFVQLIKNIELRVAEDKIISKINLSPENIEILSKLIHIAGDTKFDDNVIVGRMLKAGSVTADKMNVSSLSAICATIGLLRTATSGKRMEIESNQLRVYDAKNRLRVRLGVW